MSEIIIRLAKETDLPSIITLIGQDDMRGDDEVIDLAEAKSIFSNLSINPAQKIYVADIEGAIVGTSSLTIINHLSHNGAKSGIIEDVVVKSELQGHGIGKKMMDFSLEELKSIGCYKVCLSSGIARERSHAFYQNLGFKKHGYSFYLKF